MKIPHTLHALLARIVGQALAYETPDEVTARLQEQRSRIEDKRLPGHLRGAARISGNLAYQPGLVDLAGEAYDSALYLEALLTAARSGGHAELADALQEAAAVYHDAAAVLEKATRATVPAPQAPLGRAA